MATWHCRKKQPGEKERNPVTGEYFDEEAIDRPAQALVREVIQNSLDARANGDAVLVRFFVSGSSAALSADRAARWLTGAWDHLKAADSGLRDVPERPGACPFLLVEDFSTIGLEGEPAASDLRPSVGKNHFYAFFRAEGVSENRGGRGKWGVGKTVFARSSSVNTLFGLTVRRSDNRRLLMGQATLRFHEVDTAKYAPDVMFGELQGDDFVLPIEDAGVLNEFCQDFRVHRHNEPGLSVVVPYCHEEITIATIIQAVAREYFFPILTGRLTVVVEGPDLGSESRTLNSNTLLNSIESNERDIDGDLRSLIDFAIWAHTLPPGEAFRLEMPLAEEPPAWSSSLFPVEGFARLASRFARGEPVALRIPLPVVRTTTGHQTQASYFDLFLRQDLTGRGYPPVFIRNGIIIPKALERRVRGYRLFALVIIDDKPLAEMLGDAETPAHTQWSHQTQNFRGKYEHGKPCLDFVRSAPRQTAELLSGERRERDRLALANFFPRPLEDDGLEATYEQKQQAPGERPEGPPTRHVSEPQPFQIEQIRGGFCVRRTSLDIVCPPRLEISVAYDRSRGNPLSRYHRADFLLGSMRKRLPGVREVTCRDNLMILDVLEDEFRIEVTGFDENRDVYVRVRSTERDE